MPYRSTVFALSWGLLSAAVLAADPPSPSADDIIKQSYAVPSGEDSLSRITFNFQDKTGADRKLTYFMAWKSYKKGEVWAKTLMFKEAPSDGKGTGYMSFFYQPELNKNDEEWLYMADLRMVRKLTHTGTKSEKEDEFGGSELQQYDLQPRNPSLDSHQLLRSEPLDGVDCYVIENIPKPNPPTVYPYGKTIKWIAKDSHVPLKIQYFSSADVLLKTQTFAWKQIGNNWVWEEVVAVNERNTHKTTLTITDIRLNVGLSDDVFTKRTMTLGPSVIK